MSVAGRFPLSVLLLVFLELSPEGGVVFGLLSVLARFVSVDVESFGGEVATLEGTMFLLSLGDFLSMLGTEYVAANGVFEKLLKLRQL